MRRSSRRRRTVSAYRDGDRTVVLVPAGLSAAEEQRWVELMLRRLRNGAHRRPSDTALRTRALELAERYLGGQVRPSSVRWVDNQNTRWGSCSPADGSIRISRRLSRMPGWVVDYVLIHELAHLAVPGHGPEFWQLVNRYPRSERARGYLEGVSDAPRLIAEERGRDEHAPDTGDDGGD